MKAKPQSARRICIGHQSEAIPNAEILKAAIQFFYDKLLIEGANAAIAFPPDQDFPDNPEPGFTYLKEEFTETKDMVKFLRRSRCQLETSSQEMNKATLRSAEIEPANTVPYADMMRLMLIEYLVIVESDLPVYLLWIALLFTRDVNRKQKLLDVATPGMSCKHPTDRSIDRFVAIAREAKAIQDDPTMPQVVRDHAAILAREFPLSDKRAYRGLYHARVRNAVAHSQYRIISHGRGGDNGAFMSITREYSPLTRKMQASQLAGTAAPCYSYKAVKKLLEVANAYYSEADRVFSNYRWNRNWTACSARSAYA